MELSMMIIAIICISAVAFTAIWFFWLKRPKTEEQAVDLYQKRVWNLISEYANGYVEGIIKAPPIETPSGRKILTYFPFAKQGETEVPKPQTIVIGKGRLKPYDDSHVMVLPKEIEPLSRKMGDSLFKDFLQKNVTYENVLDNEFGFLTRKDESQANIMKKLSGGEISKELLKQIDEVMKTIKTIAEEEKPKIPPKREDFY